MTSQHKILYEIIKVHNRENPIKRFDLLRVFNTPSEYITDREMRKLKEELITDYHIPIGSNEHGYYLCKTFEDVNEARKYIRKKAMPLLKQRSLLKRISPEFFGVQPRLI